MEFTTVMPNEIMRTAPNNTGEDDSQLLANLEEILGIELTDDTRSYGDLEEPGIEPRDVYTAGDPTEQFSTQQNRSSALHRAPYSPRENGSAPLSAAQAPKLLKSERTRAIEEFILNNKRKVIGSAALVGVLVTGIVANEALNDKDAPIASTDLSHLDAPQKVADAKVEYTTDIHYGVQTGIEGQEVTYYLTTDQEITQGLGFASWSDGKLPENLLYVDPTDKEGNEVNRLPQAHYANSPEILVHKTDGAVAMRVDEDDRVTVSRNAFALSAFSYEPGDPNAPKGTDQTYDSIVLSASEAISQESVDKLNGVIDADPDQEGIQQTELMSNALYDISLIPLSNNEWQCQQDARAIADKYVLNQVVKAIQDQTGKKVNVKDITLEGDYISPQAAYRDFVKSADISRNEDFIVDHRLKPETDDSCSVTAADGSGEKTGFYNGTEFNISTLGKGN